MIGRHQGELLLYHLLVLLLVLLGVWVEVPCGCPCENMSVLLISFGTVIHSHDGSAQEGNTNHEHPARNNGEKPEDIA